MNTATHSPETHSNQLLPEPPFVERAGAVFLVVREELTNPLSVLRVRGLAVGEGRFPPHYCVCFDDLDCLRGVSRRPVTKYFIWISNDSSD